MANIEDIEKEHCSECSGTGHWGWCDAPWIKCKWKDQIKEILGLTDHKYKSLSEQIDDLGIDLGETMK